MKSKGFTKPTYQEAMAKLKAKQAKAKTMPKRAKTPCKSSLKRGSMVKPIPLKMREELAEDPFMKNCCIGNFKCVGRVQWHHNLIYASKRQNEKGSILPLCEFHHQKEGAYKPLLNAIMYSRMTDSDRAKYPRRKWL